MNFGYFRLCVATPELRVADTEFNAKKICDAVLEAQKKGAGLLVFPELSVTGYTCQDLFLQSTLQAHSIASLKALCRATRDTNVLFCAGVPLVIDSALYNTAAFIHKGKVRAIIPKSYIPNYSEFYEERWFTPYIPGEEGEISLGDGFDNIPFGTNILIRDAEDPLITIAAEICEDLWVPISPSARHALAGATIIANLSAGNEVVRKADYRRLLVSAHSAKTVSCYVYAGAGHDESTSDMVFSGHSMICLNGVVKAEVAPFSGGEDLLTADVDLERLRQDRLRSNTFTQNVAQEGWSSRHGSSASTRPEYRVITIDGLNKIELEKDVELFDTIDPHPFVPQDTVHLRERCRAVIELQSEGLAKRLRHIAAKTCVIGLSGGLDSTLALLVTARALKKCGMPMSAAYAVTMPCFGTTERTLNNARHLASIIGATFKEVNIERAVEEHFKNIEQDAALHDVTYENAQARERTQVLMDLANKTGGIVIGTGDLSELALGWCTYNGDHMSMYGVNSSIPKTLVRHLVSYFALEDASLSDVLNDILATPVSPELLPPEGGVISQKTEEVVGPYELHDFVLYYVLRWGFSPEKIRFLAEKAFLGKQNKDTGLIYTKEVILKWMKTFYKRFFSQQFKRNCMPDGAKVGTVNLSPRGDWRMPSDASAAAWLRSLEQGDNTPC